MLNKIAILLRMIMKKKVIKLKLKMNSINQLDNAMIF